MLAAYVFVFLSFKFCLCVCLTDNPNLFALLLFVHEATLLAAWQHLKHGASLDLFRLV